MGLLTPRSDRISNAQRADPEVQQALVEGLCRSNALLNLAAIPTVVLAAVLFWGRVETGHFVTFAAVVLTFEVLGGWRVPSGPDVLPPAVWIRRFGQHHVLTGIGWGSAPLIMMPSKTEDQFLLAVLLVGALLSTVVYATFFRPFLTGVGVSALLMSLGFAVNGSSSTGLLIVLFLYTIPFLAVMGLAKRLSDERAAVFGVERARLAERLEGEHDRLELALEQVAHAAAHDPLTGLLNRTAFLDHLEGETMALRPGEVTGVVFVDLDHFKAINDGLGHQAGDEVLRVAANRLSERLPAGGAISRFGGDELCVALPCTSEIESVRRWARQLHSAFDEPVALEGQMVPVSASFGLTVAEPGHLADGVIRRADLALYDAKHNGRSGIGERIGEEQPSEVSAGQ